MNEPMIPRQLHLPAWIDEELRMLAFVTKLSKEELMRRMIGQGLATAWDELEQKAPLSIQEQPLPVRTEIHPRAQTVFAQRRSA